MKKKRGLTIKIHFTNRWLYFLITLGILALVGVGVYAVDTSKAWHSAEDIDFSDAPDGTIPSTAISNCSEGEILKMIEGVWTCAPDSYITGWCEEQREYGEYQSSCYDQLSVFPAYCHDSWGGGDECRCQEGYNKLRLLSFEDAGGTWHFIYACQQNL
jgi:hypothetical protein